MESNSLKRYKNALFKKKVYFWVIDTLLSLAHGYYE